MKLAYPDSLFESFSINDMPDGKIRLSSTLVSLWWTAMALMIPLTGLIVTDQPSDAYGLFAMTAVPSLGFVYAVNKYLANKHFLICDMINGIVTASDATVINKTEVQNIYYSYGWNNCRARMGIFSDLIVIVKNGESVSTHRLITFLGCSKSRARRVRTIICGLFGQN